MDAWEALLGVPLDPKSRRALTRLAYHCRRLNMPPDFNAAARDALHADLCRRRLRRCDRILNGGLAALREAVAVGSLAIDVVASYPTPRLARKAANAALGKPFLDDLASYLADTQRPMACNGRSRPPRASLAKNHRTALLRAARICIADGQSPSSLDDLVTPAARRAIITAYGCPTSGNGGLSAIYNALVAVADIKGSCHAGDVRHHAALAREGLHAIRSNDLQALARYHVGAVRDDLIAGLAAPLGALDGRSRLAADDLWSAQIAFAGLLTFYGIANWDHVQTLGFTGVPRRTCFGTRPLLVAAAAPDEPFETRLPTALSAALDAYFTALPPALQQAGHLFAGHDGTARFAAGVHRRLCARLRALKSGLTPHGLVDLAVADMVWDATMTTGQMAVAARFTTEASFRKRYDRLIANINTLRHTNKGQRPSREAAKPIDVAPHRPAPSSAKAA